MKAILEFNLPEDTQEYENAMNGQRLSIVISDLLNYLRQKSKYENFETLPISVVREKIYELLNDMNIKGEF